ncbi:MAG: hypothetical protein LBD99_01240 [Candidatus Margulisbacteria bacterium]|jgi:hypothetical protein|nr:hypothetical protein [Candidatus Margulisiibacteriota bacterium]
MGKKKEQTAEQTKPSAPLPGADEEQIDLHELQIKLEKIRAYVKRTEMRINASELNLRRLREKRQDAEDKRLGIALVRKSKTENKV